MTLPAGDDFGAGIDVPQHHDVAGEVDVVPGAQRAPHQNGGVPRQLGLDRLVGLHRPLARPPKVERQTQVRSSGAGPLGSRQDSPQVDAAFGELISKPAQVGRSQLAVLQLQAELGALKELAAVDHRLEQRLQGLIPWPGRDVDQQAFADALDCQSAVHMT